ncbi:glycoside hydrolase family 78 protein [Paenibacillus sp. MMS20-IR301]|uniref:glycoside hydrolase family 78 protein n=1 Tax=Paenibacillus sp. MMS20-IR301 TaxID=2895946 RepID=UPI0028E71057|nr:glycoside hydrolase family 78 protein [Paenibacillus sp. MMS20-IR301]WNS46668.1 glycoside hydrolase family 78 protein [Paenibacillus sp. MMS20-IR301]
MTMSVVDCRTEYLVNPLGLDVLQPRLFWKLETEAPAAVQTAYQILVSASPAELEQDRGEMWDSGRTESSESAHIVYQGAPLQAEAVYYWKVRVWDRQDRVSPWSGPALWSMGILARRDWKAKWIGRKAEQGLKLQPSPFFRKEFKLAAPVKRAVIYATALGLYHLRVNGVKTGELFCPGWTDYDTRVQVQAYDVTDRVATGANTLAVILGEGWYAGTVGFISDKIYGERPFLSLQLSVEYEDGSRERIVTDGSWRTRRGPIDYSDMILGERYDATRELTGWDRTGYDDSGWEQPDIRPGYNGLLTASMEPPVRITKSMTPLSLRRTEAGTYIYDMGQNMVGWSELKVTGERGTQVTVSHAEMLNPDGSLYLDNLRVAVQQEHYILKGGVEERYEPHFTFHGFRYVELAGYPGEPDLGTITGKVIHSDTPVTGSLVTSDPMVNQLYSNITWGQRGNFLSVPTDCPQRDERLGWTGDAQIFARTASYNMDVSRFFNKFMWDMIDAQQPSGAFTDVAPDAGWIRYKMWSTRLDWFAPDNAGWGDAGVVIPWTLYLMYGDTRILETHYAAMVRWVEYLESMTDGLVRPDYANYGDWLSIGADTPNDVLATAYFAYSTKLLADIAGVLGKPGDQERFTELFTAVAGAFRNAFVAENGRIQGGTQTVYVLALQFGLLTAEQQTMAVRHLAADIQARGNRLSTGFLGVGYLLPVLADHGQLDLAYSLLTQEEFPSWMYSVKAGATTIWERWDGWTEENGFQTPEMNSFNHYSLGSVGEWMFRYMAGIEADPQQPGFKHTVIRPQPGGKLTSVKAGYESLYGRIETRWQRSADGVFRLTVEIPANTTATVYLPGSGAQAESAGQMPAPVRRPAEAGGQGEAVFYIGSGTYSFTSIL